MNKTVLKTMLTAVAAVLFSFTSVAQTEVDPNGKYGADSLKCLENLSLYRDYYKQKMNDDAYKFWRWAYLNCPASSEQMYLDGGNLVEHKLRAAKTDEAKAAYIDTLLQVYDNRIKYFGKEGYILGRKGTDMLRYLPNDPLAVYTVLDKSVSLQGMNSEAGALVSHFTAATMLEKKGELEKEEVVEIFSNTSEILAENLRKYEGKSTHKYYVMAQERIEEMAAPYLNCDVLIKMAKDNFENNKADTAWLERNANVLERKGCTDADIYFKMAQAYHSIKPSALSSEKMGITSLKSKRYSQALNYFNEAIKLSTSEDKKADYYIGLAQTYSSMGQYAEARVNAKKAANARSGFGLPYVIIGDLYVSTNDCGDDPCLQKAVYWLAVDYYQKAKSVDPSIASTANKKIDTYSKYFPTTNECFFKDITEGKSVEVGCWIQESTKARFN